MTGIGSKRDSKWLSAWIRDPKSIKPDARMPDFNLQRDQMAKLVDYLSTQK